MDVNGVSSAKPEYAVAQTAAKTADVKTKDSSVKEEKAAVYESSKNTSKTDSSKKTYKPDKGIVAQMKADMDQRQSQLKSLVEKMMIGQGQTYNKSTDIFQVLREGKLKVSPEVSAQAQKDIADDGYWGVEQTSERLFSFASALSGGDPAKADKMMAAVQKGFKQATKSWGDELPDICSRTLDATMEKMEKWKNSLNQTDVEQ